jgi:hypothetical protein
MRIGISKGTRRLLVVAVLAFSGWWYLQSWVAYRNVEASIKLSQETLNAWYIGTCDTTRYVAFTHYPVFMCCLLALAVLALIPDSTNERQKK